MSQKEANGWTGDKRKDLPWGREKESRKTKARITFVSRAERQKAYYSSRKTGGPTIYGERTRSREKETFSRQHRRKNKQANGNDLPQTAKH